MQGEPQEGETGVTYINSATSCTQTRYRQSKPEKEKDVQKVPPVHPQRVDRSVRYATAVTDPDRRVRTSMMNDLCLRLKLAADAIVQVFIFDASQMYSADVLNEEFNELFESAIVVLLAVTKTSKSGLPAVTEIVSRLS